MNKKEFIQGLLYGNKISRALKIIRELQKKYPPCSLTSYSIPEDEMNGYEYWIYFKD